MVLVFSSTMKQAYMICGSKSYGSEEGWLQFLPAAACLYVIVSEVEKIILNSFKNYLLAVRGPFDDCQVRIE